MTNMFNANGYSGHVRTERDRQPPGRNVTAAILGDPPPGRSAQDKLQGAPEIPEDERRDWKQGARHLGLADKPRKRARRGATHYGVKL